MMPMTQNSLSFWSFFSNSLASLVKMKMGLYGGATVAVLVLLAHVPAVVHTENTSDTSGFCSNFEDANIVLHDALCTCADQCNSDGIEWVSSTLVRRGWPKLAQCGLRLAQQARVIVDFTL